MQNCCYSVQHSAMPFEISFNKQCFNAKIISIYYSILHTNSCTEELNYQDKSPDRASNNDDGDVSSVPLLIVT